MNNPTKICLVLLLSLGVPAPVSAQKKAELSRFALFIGANDGGADRVKLRYAESDARAMARVIGELGGVSTDNVAVLMDPKPGDVDAALAAMSNRLERARGLGHRVELLVYFSGHSDEQGLLLGGQHYDYARLRASIQKLPSHVHIAVLDSCASGAFTRTKGGVRRASFLLDESSQVTGYAFLASSSADEAAQESDRIRASFFTHFFISGLRGAADMNRDRRVTLGEAYRFAFDETVARTQTTQAGPQHPAYDMHLAGTGDVVMTDLRDTSASLFLAAPLSGRLFVRDAKDHLVVELTKHAGHPVALGLGAERHEITLVRDARAYRAVADLSSSRTVTLDLKDFSSVGGEEVALRGGAPEARPTLAYVSMVPPLDTGSADQPERAAVALSLLAGRTHSVRGASIAGLGIMFDDSITGASVAGLGVLTDDARGVMVSGLATIAKEDGSGLHISGLANFSGASFSGIQLAGLTNYGGASVEGAQIGLVNIGGAVTGAQIGLVNIADRARGLQLGLVNVANTHSGAPIGLVSWVKDGHHAIEAWSSEMAAANLGVKLGSRRIYGIATAGLGDGEYLFGLGFGVHTPALGSERLYLDVDALAYQLFEHDFEEAENDMITSLRAGLGFRATDSLAVFGGLSANAGWAFGNKPGEDVAYFGTVKRFEDNGVRLWPGLFAGLSY